MQDGLSAPVIGPSTILPRGYLWLPAIWCSAALMVLGMDHWLPIWYRLTAAAGLLCATLTFVVVLSMVTVKAFAADGEGIRLGLPATTRRRGGRRRRARYLTWAEVERVRIARRPYGARLEIMLSDDAPIADHPRIMSRLAALIGWLILLVIPLSYLWRSTGVVSPLSRPPRYRIALRYLTAEQARLALREVAPPDVKVAVQTRRRQSVSSASSASTTRPQTQQI